MKILQLVAATPDVGNMQVKLGHSGNSVGIAIAAGAVAKILIDYRRKDNIISLMFSRCVYMFWLTLTFTPSFWQNNQNSNNEHMMHTYTREKTPTL